MNAIERIEEAIVSVIEAEKLLAPAIEEHTDIGHIIYALQDMERRLNKAKTDLI